MSNITLSKDAEELLRRIRTVYSKSLKQQVVPPHPEFINVGTKEFQEIQKELSDKQLLNLAKDLKTAGLIGFIDGSGRVLTFHVTQQTITWKKRRGKRLFTSIAVAIPVIAAFVEIVRNIPDLYHKIISLLRSNP